MRFLRLLVVSNFLCITLRKKKTPLCLNLGAGLARKEDFPYITYYCPHCQALNRPKQSDERVSGSSTPTSGSIRGVPSTDVLKTTSVPASESVITSNASTRAVPEKNEEVTKVAADLVGQGGD